MGKRGIKIPVKKKEISKYLHNVWTKKTKKIWTWHIYTCMPISSNLRWYHIFIFTLSIKRAVQIKGKRRERKKENNIEPLKNKWKISPSKKEEPIKRKSQTIR